MTSTTRILIGSTTTTSSSTKAYLRYVAQALRPAVWSGSSESRTERDSAPTVTGIALPEGRHPLSHHGVIDRAAPRRGERQWLADGAVRFYRFVGADALRAHARRAEQKRKHHQRWNPDAARHALLHLEAASSPNNERAMAAILSFLFCCTATFCRRFGAVIWGRGHAGDALGVSCVPSTATQAVQVCQFQKNLLCSNGNSTSRQIG